MALNIQRLNFDPATGDNASEAFMKIDLNVAEIATAIDGDGDENIGLEGRLSAVEAVADGLGDAATKDVGTTAGTVAAGDDPRLRDVGTTAGTVAAGDDARITGAASKTYVDTQDALAMPKNGGIFTGAVRFNADVTVAAPSVFASLPEFQSGIKTVGITTKLGVSGNYGANKYNFMWASGNFALYIDSTGIGNVQFSTSDYRIKKDVEYVNGGDLAGVLAGKPCTWEYRDIAVWTADGIRHRGFIAHELQEIDPLLASGEKDAVDENGNILVQQLDPIALISKLWGALQEEAHLRMALEERISALESAQA